MKPTDGWSYFCNCREGSLLSTTTHHIFNPFIRFPLSLQLGFGQTLTSIFQCGCKIINFIAWHRYFPVSTTQTPICLQQVIHNSCSSCDFWNKFERCYCLSRIKLFACCEYPYWCIPIYYGDDFDGFSFICY